MTRSGCLFLLACIVLGSWGAGDPKWVHEEVLATLDGGPRVFLTYHQSTQ